jgi:hypothetical protein
LRAYAIEPKALELKVAQMIMFAILLNNQTASGAQPCCTTGLIHI